MWAGRGRDGSPHANRWGGWIPVRHLGEGRLSAGTMGGEGGSLWNDGLCGDGRFANRPYGRRSGCMGRDSSTRLRSE